MKGAALLLVAVLPASALAEPPASAFAGTWRATIALPGGELPFTLRVDEKGGSLSAAAINGEEERRFDVVRREGSSLLLRFEVYDSEIQADLSADGARLAGEWTKPVGVRLPFSAARGDTRRFLPGADVARKSAPSVGGAWLVVFRNKDGDETARGEFTQVGERVRGTFLTPTGDHRYLEGDFRDDVLRLSGFDGGHAFLYSARRQADGTLLGEFWSGAGKSPTPWTGRPVSLAGNDGLPDEFAEAGLANPEGRLRFTFPDLDGQAVSLSDPRFAGRVVVVNVFGTWCPNCNDEAPLLGQWYRRYHDRGFEIVGLAYEATGDRETDTRSVRTFARHYDVQYPLLLAGIRDRAAALKTLPDVTGLLAFPTTIFVGRDGRVRRIHSGYAGPGTGSHHQKLVAELDSLLEGLLAEPAPKTGAASAGP